MSRRRITNLASILPIAILLGGSIAACVGEDAATPVSPGGVDAGLLDDAGTSDSRSLPDGHAPGAAGASARGLVFATTAKVDGAFAAAAKSGGPYVPGLWYGDGTGPKSTAAARMGEMPSSLRKGDDGSAPALFTRGKLDLVKNGSNVPLDRTATGAPVDFDENPMVAWVWTGTEGSGEVALSTCKSWTSASASDTGATGNARKIPESTTTDWTALGNRPCDSKRRFYCFQKP